MHDLDFYASKTAGET